mmetsp:Transcript_117087/g.294609  ORF Transcript_117087/g.294609 Transcript_117087/m.294609 type:complete len:289 (+) Transcript_117087:639-1505(+)
MREQRSWTPSCKVLVTQTGTMTGTMHLHHCPRRRRCRPPRRSRCRQHRRRRCNRFPQVVRVTSRQWASAEEEARHHRRQLLQRSWASSTHGTNPMMETFLCPHRVPRPLRVGAVAVPEAQARRQGSADSAPWTWRRSDPPRSLGRSQPQVAAAAAAVLPLVAAAAATAAGQHSTSRWIRGTSAARTTSITAALRPRARRRLAAEAPLRPAAGSSNSSSRQCLAALVCLGCRGCHRPHRGHRAHRHGRRSRRGVLWPTWVSTLTNSMTSLGAVIGTIDRKFTPLSAQQA